MPSELPAADDRDSELLGANERDRAGAAGLELSHHLGEPASPPPRSGREYQNDVQHLMGKLQLATPKIDVAEQLKLADLRARLLQFCPHYPPPGHATQRIAGPGFEAGAHGHTYRTLDHLPSQGVVVDVCGWPMMATVGSLCSVSGSTLDVLTRQYLASGARESRIPMIVDRDPLVTKAVLQWLQAPGEIPVPMWPEFHADFLKEIRFWGLDCKLGSDHHLDLASALGSAPPQSTTGGGGNAAGPPPPPDRGHRGVQPQRHGAVAAPPMQGPATPPMQGPAAFAPSASRMFVLGGYAHSPDCDAGMQLSSVQSYDSVTQTWTTQHPQMPVVCHDLAACSLDGRIYVCGGRNKTWKPMGSVFVLEDEGWRQRTRCVETWHPQFTK